MVNWVTWVNLENGHQSGCVCMCKMFSFCVVANELNNCIRQCNAVAKAYITVAIRLRYDDTHSTIESDRNYDMRSI